MIENIFSKLGDIVAPPRSPFKNLMTFIGSQSELAVQILKDNPELDINARDDRLGICPLHMCAIKGDLITCVYLLTLKVDISVVSSAEESAGYTA